MLSFISLLLGYLLGSINPAYLLGKYLKGIDIRKYGDENAGATNAARVLGKGPAILVAIFDLSKGLLAMGLAYLLGISLIFVYLSGLLAIIGHIFPFYLNFRGGQGAATATGLLFYYLFLLFSRGQLPLILLALLALYISIMAYILRKQELIGIFVMPFLLFWIIYYGYHNINLPLIFISIVILFLFVLNILNLIKKRALILKPQTKKAIWHWRVVLRPLAMIFPTLYIFLDKKITLIIIGAVALPFLILDISRLSLHQFNQLLYRSAVEIFRRQEKKKFSSIAIFFVACFLTVAIFPKTLAITAISFLVLGDIASKFFGLQFGRVKLFERTLEGSLAYFLTCLLVGFFFSLFLNLNLWTILLGSLAAATAEVLPFGIDDNFTVPLLSGIVMWLINTKIF